jgi:hypothetical protein
MHSVTTVRVPCDGQDVKRNMATKHVLLIGGTLNQTKAMLAVGAHLSQHGHACAYTPFYADGLLQWAADRGWLDFTALAGRLRDRAHRCLQDAGVPIDDRGTGRDFDLVVTCTDLVIQKNLRGRKVVLVQEGLTEPEGITYLAVRYLGLPRVMANTAAFGLSHHYAAFCVASHGYRDLYRRKGVRPDSMIVTGIPNFDHAERLRDNHFPHRDFVLVCTSNARETFKRDNRLRFLRDALRIADGRPVIVKLHPGERHDRAIREVHQVAPEALVLTDGNTEEMIANAGVVIAQYSTVVFTAAALGKELHSYLDPDMIRRLLPIQNGGRSAAAIAGVCLDLMHDRPRSTVWEAQPGDHTRASVPDRLHYLPH